MFVFLIPLLGCPQAQDSEVKEDDSVEDSEPGETAQPGEDADADGYFADDCDDTNPAINPGADEVCDSLDNDCDGLTDDDDVEEGIGYAWYLDADHDGYGDDASLHMACTPGAGEVSFGGDCDDTNNDVFPGAQELCEGGIDEDCDGLVDDEDPDTITGEFWFTDVDGDGYGGGTGLGGCDQPPDTVAGGGDCDDADPTVSPEGTEICDPEDKDEDCDGGADDDDPNGTPSGNFAWFLDDDGDGWGVDTDQTYSCDGEEGYAASYGDCDPADPTIHPEAEELCDGIDQDCDGIADNGADGWYPDEDGDGYGDGSAVASCDSGVGVMDHSDCDDGDATINPLGTEVCGVSDEDCDGLIDSLDDSLEADYVYTDNDGDGYGDDTTAVIGCGTGAPLSELGGDCDDTNAEVSPGEPERFGDLSDDNCDGLTSPAWDACVGTSVPADYATITEAVAVVEAAGGGTICVASGTYVEDVAFGVAAPVTLMGEDPEAAVIEGVVAAYAQATMISQLTVIGGVQVYPEAGFSSVLSLADLRVEGAGQPGLWVWFGSGGTLALDLSGLDLTADAPSAGFEVSAESCEESVDEDFVLNASGVWIHDASYGVELLNSGSDCAQSISLDWVTLTDDEVGVRAEVSGGSIALGVDHSLLVGNTTGVSWGTVSGGGTVTGSVTNSMFYGNTADFGDSANAGTGYVWGVDPLLDTTYSPPLPGTPARDAFPTDSRADYWGSACASTGCDYGAIEGG